MSELRIKRIYEPPEPGDGFRVLVDRLWPRGLTKQAAAIDLWLKEVAPSNALRTWFGHKAERWPEFVIRYDRELEEPERAAALERLARLVREKKRVTLLFSTREEKRNHASHLRDRLD